MLHGSMQPVVWRMHCPRAPHHGLHMPAGKLRGTQERERANPELNRALGERIRERRTARRYTQAGLAERADLTPAHLGGIERGETSPSMNTLAKLAKALNVEMGSFLEGLSDLAKLPGDTTLIEHSASERDLLQPELLPQDQDPDVELLLSAPVIAEQAFMTPRTLQSWLSKKIIKPPFQVVLNAKDASEYDSPAGGSHANQAGNKRLMAVFRQQDLERIKKLQNNSPVRKKSSGKKR